MRGEEGEDFVDWPWASTDCKIMKNRSFLGSLPEQSVRQKSKPFIVEMKNNK